MLEKIECVVRDVGMSLDKEGDATLELKFSPGMKEPIGEILNFLVSLTRKAADVELSDNKLTIAISEEWLKANEKEAN